MTRMRHHASFIMRAVPDTLIELFAISPISARISDRIPMSSPCTILMAPPSGKPSGGRTCCRVLQHASDGKSIAGMEQLRLLCRNKCDRNQSGFFHQLSPELEVIVHASKRAALFQSEDDMVGSAVNLRGRNIQVQIVDRVAEKLQQIVLQQGIKGCAARRRRLKRRSNCLAVAAAGDRNIRAIQLQFKGAVAVLKCKSCSQSDGGMSTKRHFT